MKDTYTDKMIKLIEKFRLSLFAASIGFQFKKRGTDKIDTIQSVETEDRSVRGCDNKPVSIDDVILIGKTGSTCQ